MHVFTKNVISIWNKLPVLVVDFSSTVYLYLRGLLITSLLVELPCSTACVP